MADKWLFYIASDMSFGGGHVARSLQLANAMREHVCIDICLDIAPSYWDQRLRDLGYNVIKGLSQIKDSYHAIWVDHYEADMAQLKALNIPISGIVDMSSQEGRYDLALSYVSRADADLFGFQYALIDPLYSRIEPTPAAFLRYTLCFGQTDSNQSTLKVLNMLEGYSEQLYLNIVCGKTNAYKEKIMDAVACSKHDAHIINSPSDLFSVFEKTDVFITAGGVSVLEGCAAGVVCMVMCTAENQVDQAKALAQHGAVLQYGLIDDLLLESLFGGIDALKDNTYRHRISSCSKNIIDGKGAERVSSALLKWRKLFHG